MEEKIKISLPKTLLELLKKDCQDFKILKDDNKTNMNLFINTLIANFYEEFSAHEEQLHEDMKRPEMPHATISSTSPRTKSRALSCSSI